MSGYYHRQQESISPYSMENPTSSDDETYLQMNQFQDKESNSRNCNIRSNVKNILTLQNCDQSASCRVNFLSSSGYDRSHELGNSKSNEFGAHRPLTIAPNYSKWDPTKRANRAPAPIPPRNPPVLARLPPKPSDGPAIVEDQEDYLTFESSAPDLSIGHGQQPKRHLPEEPPPRPPRSPARLPSGYDDHTLPFRLPAFPHDQPPERPPPLPPTQMSPNHTTPPYPSPISRHGSDKSSPSVSPGSSRPSSMKDQAFSHIPQRKTNYSTESSGSTSSDEPGQGTRPPYVGTPSKFVQTRPDRVEQKFPKIPAIHRPSIPCSMPSFDPPSASKTLEEQPYFKNVDRDTAQNAIYSMKKDGAFLVRPRDESSKPYALTLWANNKFYNFIIRQRTSDDKYALGRRKEDEKAFDSVANLIEHFRSHEVVLAESEGCVKLTVSPP